MEDLFLRYLQAGFFGGVAIVVVLVLRLCLRKAPRQLICVLWLLVAVRLLIPFAPQSSLSLQPELPAYLSPSQQQPEQFLPDTGMPEMPFLPDAPPISVTPEIPNTPDVSTPPDMPQVQESIHWEEIVFAAWVIGAAAMMLVAVISYLRLQRTVRMAVKTLPGVYVSDRITGAFVMGYWKPRVYLPADLPDEDVPHILAHEQAHIARGDHWWKLLGYICLCIHWYNPLVWVCYVLFCRDTEVACDERVVWPMELAQRKAYSHALLNCGKRYSGLTAVTLCFGKLSLAQRIKNVLSYRKPGLWITAVAGMLAVTVAICFLTVPKPEQRDIDVPGATEMPTQEPTQVPTETPTQGPTQAPTETPTQSPTEAPTQAPTETPAQAPTETPTETPTQVPTEVPTEAPSRPPTQDDGVIARGTWGGNMDEWCLTADGVFTVSGSRHIEGTSEYEWSAYADLITEIVIEEGITEIPSAVFMQLPNLKSVHLSNTLTSVPQHAFSQCSKLESIMIPGNVTEIGLNAFYGCTNLQTVEFAPNGKLEIIDSRAFSNTAITQFVAPNSLRQIDTYAFSECSSLQTVILKGNELDVAATTFRKSYNIKKVVLEESVTRVGPNLLADAINIEHLEDYTSQGHGNFENKTKLKTVVLGEKVRKLMWFTGCTSLSDITIQAPIDTIESRTFCNCTSLTEIVIPNTVTKVEFAAFENTGITKIVFPASVTELGGGLFVSEHSAVKQAAIKEIVFLGDMPKMQSLRDGNIVSANPTFLGVTATVYYPANNPTWTEDKLQNYGGNITWVAVE